MHGADRMICKRVGSLKPFGEMMKRVFLTCALTVLAVSARADDWHDATNYPARVAAFTFGSQVLDSNHSVHFGSWTVSYGAQGLPTMRGTNGSDGTSWTAAFPPPALVCANAVLGRTGCTIILTNPDLCSIAFVPALDANIQTLKIPCPTSVAFQR
jgi:hypothetical protein